MLSNRGRHAARAVLLRQTLTSFLLLLVLAGRIEAQTALTLDQGSFTAPEARSYAAAAASMCGSCNVLHVGKLPNQPCKKWGWPGHLVCLPGRPN
jgi:hypothetical protein